MAPPDKAIPEQRDWQQLRVDVDKLADSFANSIHPRLDVLEKHRDDQYKVHRPATNKALDDIRADIAKLSHSVANSVHPRLDVLEKHLDTLDNVRRPRLTKRIDQLEDTLEALRKAVDELLPRDHGSAVADFKTLLEHHRVLGHRIAAIEARWA